MELIPFLDNENIIKYRPKRSNKGELLQSFVNSKFPKNRFFFILYSFLRSSRV